MSRSFFKTDEYAMQMRGFRIFTYSVSEKNDSINYILIKPSSPLGALRNIFYQLLVSVEYKTELTSIRITA